MKRATKPLKPGNKAVLVKAARGFIDDLPDEAQKAISEIVGKPITFNGHDELGQAELEFRERNGTFHTIWVRPEFVRRVNVLDSRRSRKRRPVC